MTRETLRDELVRELDRLSPEQPTPNQEAVREVREALSSLSEPLSKTIEKGREERI